MFFALLICKVMSFALSLIGRGSSLPGSVALKLYPDLLRKMKLPELIIAVTGSNGKTSTTEYVTKLARKTRRIVISNYEGSNQIDGIVTLFAKHSTLSGRVKADIAIVESDERFCQYTFSFFTPTYIVITNLFRDQMTRNGHNEYVFDELKKGLPKISTLILNADDPLSSAFSLDREEVIYFGIDTDVFEDKNSKSICSDRDYCIVCGGLLRYTSHLTYHLGHYQCTSCGFVRGDTTHSVTSLALDRLVIDSLYEIKPQMLNAMFAANITAAFTVGVEVLKLPEEIVVETLDGYTLTNERLLFFNAGNHKGMFMLSKHENTMAYNMSIRSIVESRSKEKTVVIVFDLLSRKYTATDISWIWDVDFELLNDDRVALIILSGAFAYDLATRMIIAGVNEQKIHIEPNINSMTEKLADTAKGDIFAMTCFTDVKKLMTRFKENV